MRLFSKISLCLLIVAVLALPPIASAQQRSVQPPKVTQLATFDVFLDANPNIERDLERNPSLLNNTSYLSSHPELKNFLDSHSTIRTQAARNPAALMHRERK